MPRNNLIDFGVETRRKGLNGDYVIIMNYIILNLSLANFRTFWPDAAQAVPFLINKWLQFSKCFLKAIFFFFFNCIKLADSASQALNSRTDLTFKISFSIFLTQFISPGLCQ